MFSRQVHGVEVLEAVAMTGQGEEEADVVVTTVPGVSVGVITADCVPILVASSGSGVVAAIHAGWRGLAQGVIERGLDTVRSRSQRFDGESPATNPGGMTAAVGPAARGCCYEVDEPVREGLAERYERHLEEVLIPTSPGHYQLDLPVLASRILEEWGLKRDQIGTAQRVCTICDADRFESYRREGDRAGRLRHFVTLSGSISSQG